MITIVYDAFNDRIAPIGGYIGTLTAEPSRTAMRHGWKLVEVYEICD